MLIPWKKQTSRYLHEESWFKLRTDSVIKGNGQPMDPYYVLEYSNWVNVFPVTTTGEVVLVRQYRYALGEFSLELPGGIMDAGETNPADAGLRELLEETGYACEAIELVSVLATNPATHNNRMYCFLATGCHKTQAVNLDENEELEVILKPMDEVVDLLRKNQILQSLHVGSMFYALQKLGKL